MRLKLIPLDRGFDLSKVVTDSSPVIERTGKFSERGVFSEAIFGRIPSTGREYSCDCDSEPIEGRFYEGIKCNVCNTAVTCRDTVFSKRGWVDLGDYQIIAPISYVHFARVIGASQFIRILQQKQLLTVDGIAKKAVTTGTVGPYDGIGVSGFIEKWEEILTYYEGKKKSDMQVAEYANVLRKCGSHVLTSKIPIFNHILRPALVVNKQFIFDEVNNLYNLLISNVNILNDYTPEEATDTNVNAVLWRIQERANEIMEHVLHILSGKGGYLRGDMLGVRINFSARCVITPLSTGFQHDEIEIPYLAFLELFRFQLINLISRMHGTTILAANEIWHNAQTKFDPLVVIAMKELIKRGSVDGRGIPALINRNPTIAFGSILLMRIVGVKEDLDDYTMGVHNGILKLIGGDYDGDVIAIIPLLDSHLANAFQVYDPRQMAISRDGPYINIAMTLDKDHVLGLHVLTEDA